MKSCPSCRGLVPVSLTACPHCDAPVSVRSRLPRALFTFAGASIAAVTLMACYGAPPCDDAECRQFDPIEDAGDTDGGETDAGTDGGETDAGDGG